MQLGKLEGLLGTSTKCPLCVSPIRLMGYSVSFIYCPRPEFNFVRPRFRYDNRSYDVLARRHDTVYREILHQ